MDTLATNNTSFGFWGTMACAGKDVARAWASALRLIATTTAAHDEAARDFLDSTLGRHFADEVCNQMARGLSLDTAIRAAVDVHMGWRIDRHTARRHGLRPSQPYLAGWVEYFGMLGEEERA